MYPPRAGPMWQFLVFTNFKLGGLGISKKMEDGSSVSMGQFIPTVFRFIFHSTVVPTVPEAACTKSTPCMGEYSPNSHAT